MVKMASVPYTLDFKADLTHSKTFLGYLDISESSVKSGWAEGSLRKANPTLSGRRKEDERLRREL